MKPIIKTGYFLCDCGREFIPGVDGTCTTVWKQPAWAGGKIRCRQNCWGPEPVPYEADRADNSVIGYEYMWEYRREKLI